MKDIREGVYFLSFAGIKICRDFFWNLSEFYVQMFFMDSSDAGGIALPILRTRRSLKNWFPALDRTYFTGNTQNLSLKIVP